jgi:hypothetical protein
MPTVQTAKSKPIEHYASRLRARNQITIPRQVAASLRVVEGSFLRFEVEQPTVAHQITVRLTPHALTPQPLTDEQWQSEEVVVDAEIKSGKLSPRYRGARRVIAALKRP